MRAFASQSITTRNEMQRAVQVPVSMQRQKTDITPSRRQLATGLLGAAAALSIALVPPVSANEGFLKKTGARGLFAEEEEKLFELRQAKETEAREELLKVKDEYEQEARESVIKNGSLCATPFGVDVVGITEFVALTGALVGGISARRRKDEMEKLNEQLRTINAQLRQQARAGTLFAPGLTYAPTTNPPSPTAAPATKEATKKSSIATLPPPPQSDMMLSIDDDDSSPELKECQIALKEGKRLLKEQAAGPAMVRFEKALMLAKCLGDKVRERRAVRGLAACSRLNGESRAAIKYLCRVLEISKEIGDFVGDADAYGTIADIYTDMGEFEKAAENYDKYINAMNEDSVV